jgi:hypothetical protein
MTSSVGMHVAAQHAPNGSSFARIILAMESRIFVSWASIPFDTRSWLSRGIRIARPHRHDATPPACEDATAMVAPHSQSIENSVANAIE